MSTKQFKKKKKKNEIAAPFGASSQPPQQTTPRTSICAHTQSALPRVYTDLNEAMLIHVDSQNTDSQVLSPIQPDMISM